MFYVQNREVFFSMVLCTCLSTLRLLLWIWRERHGGQFINQVVLKCPSIKLRVTCVCCADFRNRSWILVWILEDYGTDNWSLKQVVDTEELFGHMIIKVGSELCDQEYRVIIVHP